MAETRRFGVDYAAATMPLTGTETLSIVQGGALRDATAQDIADLASSGGTMPENRVKGRAAGAGTGTPQDLTGAQLSVIAQGDGSTADACGFRGIPVNSQSGNYTAVLADAGCGILHPNGAGAGDTFTIPANASVAYPLFTALTFVNMDPGALTIAIASDTLRLSPGGGTGSRTLAQYGMATAIKVTSTEWLVSGTGLA